MFSFLSSSGRNRNSLRQDRPISRTNGLIYHHKPSKEERDLAMRLDWVRRYYFSEAIANLNPKARRHLAYCKLIELPNMNHNLANVVIKQWDEAQKARTKFAEN
ncbi:hypothetical protein [Synechococcus sp. PCC 7336]|uniref:hypothetical protein n=1 Tax=Synechococcus sp. PCC 7336 TaxID=195250 RepID=UPI0003468B90|nr:hypothetical protein [Synechococcus sp. PCC 7336]